MHHFKIINSVIKSLDSILPLPDTQKPSYIHTVMCKGVTCRPRSPSVPHNAVLVLIKHWNHIGEHCKSYAATTVGIFRAGHAVYTNGEVTVSLK